MTVSYKEVSPAVVITPRGADHRKDKETVAEDTSAYEAHPGPDDRSVDLEHVSKITARVMLPTTRLRPCAGCGGRFMGRDLYEVMEEHESLTFFEGDRLCEECAKNHGVL